MLPEPAADKLFKGCEKQTNKKDCPQDSPSPLQWPKNQNPRLIPLPMPNPTTLPPLDVLVLMGGPDRERDVSLKSGQAVSNALREAGHRVATHITAGEGDLAPLDAFLQAHPQGIVFPALHGRWGEGGELQWQLTRRNARFVGCATEAAARCMDKAAAKAVLVDAGLPTPGSEMLTPGQKRGRPAPVVVKAVDEGSSIGLEICPSDAQADAAITKLHADYPELLVEDFIQGREITVGVIEDPSAPGGLRTLPPIHIVPAVAFYDYEAKYLRNDTEYLFETGLPPAVLAEMARISARAFRALGCRHLARMDFIVDERGPWFIEANTMPGFTDHSLLPKAAAKAGLTFPQLADHLVRLANG